MFSGFMLTSPHEYHQPVDEANQLFSCVLFIACLLTAVPIRRLYKSQGDTKKLGSFLKISNKGLDVGTSSCWSYLWSIVKLTGNAYCIH